jgi:apolipoprotein N-acyltransferase
LRQPRFFLDLARETNSGILVASQIPKTEGQTVLQSGFMNMAVLYSPDGEIAGQYQAVQPPPFAGSKPIREHTSPEYKVIDSPLGKLGILLCYEDSIPVVARKAVKAGAEILIALSNPGFFTTTHMPYYHLKQSQLRAIESGRQVIRVSANGYTAHIDSTGKVLQKSRLSTKEILYVEAGEIPSAETRRTTKTTRASTN